ncbi:hypothetical protein FJK98_32595 [Micromonospora sp. HM134]|uniref:hypothetical protein n=1 Tax=unclassified Micromonospora TaxID=2617518 RepID=UPI001198B2B0|nr:MULTISPECIES: hypothetical protein [unclassified Micromonospora]QDY11289.1 hypothetical protein FJK98_32595 [Micromonospora sp. HM134]
MSQDLPIPRQDDRSDDTPVLEWGAPERPAGGRFGQWPAALRRDRRLPPVLVLLGAVAATASMAGEWLVMTVPNGGPEGSGTIRVPGGVAEVGGFGIAYLVGLLLLSVAVALALRGRPAVRHDARVAGLAVAGALVILLTVTAFSLDDSGQRALFYSPEDGFRVDYGRGLVMAFVAVALVGAALLATAPQPDGPPVDTAGPQAEPDGVVPDGDDDRPAAPAGLTVTPTVPFARREPHP